MFVHTRYCHNEENKENNLYVGCKISHFQSLIFSKLRLKLLSCQSAEAPETQVTLMTTKRRTSTSHKRKSARKSLPIFSGHAGLPSGLTRLGKMCTLLGALRWNRGIILSKQNASFLHSTQLNKVLLAMILCVFSTNP